MTDSNQSHEKQVADLFLTDPGDGGRMEVISDLYVIDEGHRVFSRFDVANPLTGAAYKVEYRMEEIENRFDIRILTPAGTCQLSQEEYNSMSAQEAMFFAAKAAGMNFDNIDILEMVNTRTGQVVDDDSPMSEYCGCVFVLVAALKRKGWR